MSDVAILLEPFAEAVDDAAQQILAKMDAVIKESAPEASVDSGHTGNRDFFLFSYRRYSSGVNPRIDPVVVGINCEVRNGDVVVIGDICGEATGDPIYDVPSLRIPGPPSVGTLRQAVQAVASQLCAGAPDTARALRDSSRELD